MSKLKITVVLLCMACTLGVQAKGKKKNKPVYAFGLSVAFTDSIAYYTSIQKLDSVVLDADKMLPGRDQYSYQLKDYLESGKNLKDRTCIIYFNENPKKLVKEYNRVLNIQKKKNIILKEIPSAEFKYTKPEFE